MLEKLIQLANQGGEARDSGLQEYPDVQQPTEFGGREPTYKPKRLQLSPKARKLLKKKQKLDLQIEKELRETSLGDLLDEDETADLPTRTLGGAH